MEEQYTSENTWWKLRTRLERRLLIIIMTVLLALLAVMTYVFFIHVRASQVTPVCMSMDCVQAAAKFLNSIDPSVDPCDDFVRFACGNFFASSHPNATSEMVRSEISARRRFEQVFEGPPNGTDMAVRNLRYLHGICMNRKAIDDGVAHLKRELIAPLGGWPLINSNWDEAFAGHAGATNLNWIWLNYVRKLYTLGFRTDLFFHLHVHVCHTDGRNYLMLTPPTLEVDSTSREFRKQNEAFLLRTLEAFGGDRARAAYDINYLGDFTLEFIKVVNRSSNASAGSRPRDESVLITLSELEAFTPAAQIDWTQMFVTLTGNVRQLNANTTLIVGENMHEYLRDLQGLLKKTPRRVLANYIIWESLKSMQLWFNVPNAPRISLHERYHLCIDEVNQIMPLIANQELSKNNQHREVIKTMIVNIRDQLLIKLQTMKWLDQKLQIFLENKLKTIKFFIAGQLEDNQIKIDYPQEDWNNTNNYIQLISKIRSASDQFIYELLLNKTMVETTFYQLLGLDANANAYYLPNNYIGIPTGLINEMFSDTLPDYINYARIGHFIGHELAHVFSLSSLKFGLYSKKNTLCEDIIKNYTATLQCRVVEYEKYMLGKYQVMVNGSTTLNENMADLIGTHAAYEVFYNMEREAPSKHIKLPAVEGYSSGRLFWMAFARYYCDPQEAGRVLGGKWREIPHGVGSFRILSTLMKSHRFAVDFGCKKGSKMNPIRKCIF